MKSKQVLVADRILNVTPTVYLTRNFKVISINLCPQNTHTHTPNKIMVWLFKKTCIHVKAFKAWGRW